MGSYLTEGEKKAILGIRERRVPAEKELNSKKKGLRQKSLESQGETYDRVFWPNEKKGRNWSKRRERTKGKKKKILQEE